MVEYDATDIPTAYDRARVRSPEVIARWMSAVEATSDGPVRRILDLGCGTGRFSGALHDHFGAEVVGVDPSTRMLLQAVAKVRGAGADDRAARSARGAGAEQGAAPSAHESPPESGDRPALRYLIGRGEEIPLKGGSVDLVFMSMVFHHFADPPRVASECRRVLRSGGVVFLRAGTRERVPAYPPSRFFPAAVPIMERVLATAAELAAVFEGARFRALADGLLEQEIAPTFTAYAEQVAAGADSVLSQLNPEQMAAGLAALREHAARVDPTPVSEPIDFFAFQKPHPGRASAASPP